MKTVTINYKTYMYIHIMYSAAVHVWFMYIHLFETAE